MSRILTKSDIIFNQVSIERTLVMADLVTETYIWRLTCGYDVTTEEGEVIHRDFTHELTPAQRTRVVEFFSGLKGQIKAQEGIA